MDKITLFLVVMLFFISSPAKIKADEAYITVQWYVPFPPPAGIEIHDEKEIKEFWPDSVLFSMDLFTNFPIAGKDFSSGEYYMVGEEIIGYSLHIKKFDNSIYLSNITIIFIAPDNVIYYNNTMTINLTENDKVFLNEFVNESFIFDLKGLWKFSVRFESNKMNLVWKDIGNGLYQTFQPSSYHNGIAYISFHNFYNEGIPVLSGPEVLQVSQNAYIAQQTAYLNKSATAQEESAKAQKDLASKTVVVAIAAVASAVASFYLGWTSRKTTKVGQKSLEKSFNELIKAVKETKRKSKKKKAEIKR